MVERKAIEMRDCSSSTFRKLFKVLAWDLEFRKETRGIGKAVCSQKWSSCFLSAQVSQGQEMNMHHNSRASD